MIKRCCAAQKPQGHGWAGWWAYKAQDFDSGDWGVHHVSHVWLGVCYKKWSRKFGGQLKIVALVLIIEEVNMSCI